MVLRSLSASAVLIVDPARVGRATRPPLASRKNGTMFLLPDGRRTLVFPTTWSLSLTAWAQLSVSSEPRSARSPAGRAPQRTRVANPRVVESGATYDQPTTTPLSLTASAPLEEPDSAPRSCITPS